MAAKTPITDNLTDGKCWFFTPSYVPFIIICYILLHLDQSDCFSVIQRAMEKDVNWLNEANSTMKIKHNMSQTHWSVVRKVTFLAHISAQSCDALQCCQTSFLDRGNTLRKSKNALSVFKDKWKAFRGLHEKGGREVVLTASKLQHYLHHNESWSLWTYVSQKCCFTGFTMGVKRDLSPVAVIFSVR